MSRGLPKTGATWSYRNGDDAYFQQGWTILDNSVGARFKAQTIGGDDIVIDRATGLIWARSFNQAGCNNNALITWNNAIDYAMALTFAGFSDWRIPNINELLSIRNWGTTPDYYTGFTLGAPPHYDIWSSTSLAPYSAAAWLVSFSGGNVASALKTSTHYIRCVRGGFF